MADEAEDALDNDEAEIERGRQREDETEIAARLTGVARPMVVMVVGIVLAMSMIVMMMIVVVATMRSSHD